MDPDTMEILETKEFCERLVDPFGKDAGRSGLPKLDDRKLTIILCYL